MACESFEVNRNCTLNDGFCSFLGQRWVRPPLVMLGSAAPPVSPVIPGKATDTLTAILFFSLSVQYVTRDSQRLTVKWALCLTVLPDCRLT